MELRAAKDFVETYAWMSIMVVIAAMVGIGILFFWPAGQSFQHSCSIVSGFTCAAAALGYSTTGSVLFMRIANNVGSTIALPENSLTVYPYLSNVNFTGTCIPEFVGNGGSFLCIAALTGYLPKYGALISPRFTISYRICNPGCNAAGQGYYVSGSAYITAGQTLKQAAAVTSAP